MNDYTPFIVFGIITGAIYGLSAMGLVLTYKTSGVFNVGHGAVCAAAAYAFYGLRQEQGMPWQLAFLIVVFVFGPIAGLVLERLAVVLAPVSTANRIVGTVGLLVAIRALLDLGFGDIGLVFNPFLSQDEAFTIAEATVSVDDLITLAAGTVAAVALFVFFRVSRLGVAMRGVVDDPQLLSMSGTAPARVRRASWMIGSSFAAVSGILFAQNQAQLDINVLSLLVVQAFGAATIARFTNLPMAFVGGLVVGVLQAVAGKATGGNEQLQGLGLTVPFLVLFVGLLVIPRKKLVEVGRMVRARPPAASILPPQARAGVLLAGLAVLLVIPHVVGAKLPGYNVALTQVLLFVSLHLLVRTSGQISLCHFGFAAVGAAGFGHSANNGAPFFLALLIGGLWCLPLALIVAVPAIRLSGLYLALATLGFGIVLSQFAYSKSYMFGGGQLLTRRPGGFTDDQDYYYLLLAIAIAGVLAVLAVERSRLGRLLRAMSDSPLALTTLGTSVNTSRVIVFAISGFLAGISGGLYASLFGGVTQDTFNYVQSLLALAVLAIAGSRTITAAFVAPALLYVVPLYFTQENATAWLQLGFGLGAMFAAAASQGGVDTWLARGAQRHAVRAQGPAGRRMRLSLGGSTT
ncbi:ABC transporter permease [Sporichthya sp.]|uniref:branched-chain amino acid ABC transporter permease n=1 Tax=Sporichthya sp. TaxID=65475 RepID=UPI0018019206|nr:ABC transporter permease [Sporichthya sp.]MBA3744181.1 ABC transporter permease [Sporichthya sp.]